MVDVRTPLPMPNTIREMIACVGLKVVINITVPVMQDRLPRRIMERSRMLRIVLRVKVVSMQLMQAAIRFIEGMMVIIGSIN